MKQMVILAMLILTVILTGCDKQASAITHERQARQDAVRREAAARQIAQREQAKREFWQTAAYTAAAFAVLMLIVGAAAGSRCRDAATKP